MVLEPYFKAAQDVFIENGAERVAGTKLRCARWVHDSDRHLAACETTGRVIVVAPQLAEQSEPVVLAILSHELGHAVDYLYPSEFLVADDELTHHPPIPPSLLSNRSSFDTDCPPPLSFEDRAAFARMVQWNERGDDTVERTADAIAEHFTGRQIGYVGPCHLQSFEGGERPRPEGLR